MQWANSFGRSQSDRAIFFDSVRKKYYLIAPSTDSDMGYIELASGTRIQMEEINKEYERTYNAHALSGNIDKDIQRIRNEQNNDDWDNDFPRYVDKEKKNDGLSSDEIRQKANSDRARNPSGTRENFGGIEESGDKGTMKADGAFVYSFNAEKESSTRRTLHADVNTKNGANGELFLDTSISDPSESVKSENLPTDKGEMKSDRGVMNAERGSGEREFNQYASFEEQIKYIVAPENKGKRIDQSLLLGRTPKVWREIGLSDLPVMMSVSHTRENYFPQSSQYPEGKGMGKKLYQLPKKIQDPIAIFASKTHRRIPLLL